MICREAEEQINQHSSGNRPAAGAAKRPVPNLQHPLQFGRRLDRSRRGDDGVELRREHAHVVGEVADERDDVHPLREPLDLAEEQHEAVLLC